MNLEHLGLHGNKPLSRGKIEEIEKKLDIKLPAFYKIFISQYNDAIFDNIDIFIFKDEKGYNTSERLDYNGFRLVRVLDFEQIEYETVFDNIDFPEFNPKEFIPIIRADGGLCYFLCVKEEDNYGKIYFDYYCSDYNLETLYHVADSLEEFLGCLVDGETYEKLFPPEYI